MPQEFLETEICERNFGFSLFRPMFKFIERGKETSQSLQKMASNSMSSCNSSSTNIHQINSDDDADATHEESIKEEQDDDCCGWEDASTSGDGNDEDEDEDDPFGIGDCDFSAPPSPPSCPVEPSLRDPERTEPSQLEKKYRSADAPAVACASGNATRRLLADIRALDASQLGQLFTASPIDENIYTWEVRLLFPDGAIAQDLKRMGKDAVELEMIFPSQYPFVPPFVHVRRPRFAFHTGHVTVGGSICMELLTSSGWSPANDIASVLLQIRSEMVEGNARLDLNNKNDYTLAEARDAFNRVARHHGWEK